MAFKSDKNRPLLLAAILLLLVWGRVAFAFAAGIHMLVFVGVWLIVNAFLIPGLVREHNNRLAADIGAGQYLPA
jgi:uncharacterized membrane protein